jgi:ATP-dependent DNA helicase RecG
VLETGSDEAGIRTPDLRVWGRLASIRRTVGWAIGEEGRVEASPYIGVNCRRLLGQAQAEDGLNADLRQAIEAAGMHLEGFEELDVVSRLERLRALDAALDPIVPLGEIGAIVPTSSGRVDLVIPDTPSEGGAPSGRKRRRKKRGSRDAGADAGGADVGARSVEGGPDRPAGAPSEVNDSEDVASDSTADAEGDVAGGRSGQRRRRNSGRTSPDSGRTPPEVRAEPAPRPAPARRRLSLGDPDGCGAPIASLPGILPQLADQLVEAGIETWADLLLLAPLSHERAPIFQPSEPSEGVRLVRGKVQSRCTRMLPGARRWEVTLAIPDLGAVACRWVVQQPHGFERWRHGDDLALIGEVSTVDDVWTILEAEPVGVDGRGSGWLPVYGLDGIADAGIRDAVARVLHLSEDGLEDPLPADVVERNRLLDFEAAVRDAHFPANTAGRGRTRLAFEELFLLQCGIALRTSRGQPVRGQSHRALHGAVGQLLQQHGISLNDDQERAFDDLRRDMLRTAPMARLLQGDVGAGKGLVALMAAMVVAENRCQVAMVCPDALAAERRFLYAEGLLRSVGMSPLLVGETLNHAQADAVRRGEAHVVFGTSSLVKPAVTWKKLGLVVAEERGSYGTIGPDALAVIEPRPDLLVLTPVPIPTSLVFTVFGDLDVTLLPQNDKVRVKAQTFAVGARDEAYAVARDELERGRQAMVVFPVDESGHDLLHLGDARRVAEALRADAFPGRRIGVYCSEMSREERTQVFDAFSHRRLDVLVATTTIEDAPAVPGCCAMIVEMAERHDLLRLHRLRAYVGLGSRTGQWLLVTSETVTPESAGRLAELVGEKDGFKVAEIDLRERGAAALLGDDVGEAPDLRWADPVRDRALLLRARADAFERARRDPGLRRSADLVAASNLRWGSWLGALPDRNEPEDKDAGARRRRRRRRR